MLLIKPRCGLKDAKSQAGDGSGRVFGRGPVPRFDNPFYHLPCTGVWSEEADP